MGKAENKIEQYLRRKAEENGFLCLKFTSPSLSGVPDRVLIGKGLTFFVETKKANGKTQEIQNAVIDQFRKCGAVVYIIDSTDTVDKLFDSLNHQHQRC